MAQESRKGREISVPWSDAVRFIRQLSHDLRNNLNAIELQSTYIGELAENAVLKGEIKRLREMISGLSSTLQKLSRELSKVKANLISYRAADFVEDLRKRIGRSSSMIRMRWFSVFISGLGAVRNTHHPPAPVAQKASVIPRLKRFHSTRLRPTG